MTKGQSYGNDLAYYFNPAASGRYTRMAPQQRLGLLPRWRYRVDPADCFNPDLDGPHLSQLNNRLLRHFTKRSKLMNWDQIKGNWKQVKGKVKEKWGKLNDNDLDVIGGQKDQLIGKLQNAYGYQKEQAEKQVDEFLARL